MSRERIYIMFPYESKVKSNDVNDAGDVLTCTDITKDGFNNSGMTLAIGQAVADWIGMEV